MKELQLQETKLGVTQPDDTSVEGLATKNLQNTVIESLSKELNKLKRKKEILEKQQEQINTGKVLSNETNKQKGDKIKASLEREEGANVIYADPGRIQFQRHQIGQLGGLGEYTLEEVQALRRQTQEQQAELYEQYTKYRSAKELGSAIMEKFFPNIRKRDYDEEPETADFGRKEVVKEPSFKYKDFGKKEDAKIKMEKHINKNKFSDKTTPFYMQGVPSKSEPTIGRFKKEFEKENQANNATSDLWNQTPFFSMTGNWYKF